MKREWENSLKENRQTVDAEEIANVISMMSGIPVQMCIRDRNQSDRYVFQD